MTTRLTARLLLGAALLAIAARPVTADETVTCKLIDGADFFSGCFDPCKCFVNWIGVPRGNFTVALTEETPNSKVYAVESIDWLVPEIGWQIIGSGWYEITSSPAPVHRLTALLSVNGQAVEYFDSENVPYAGGFPLIDIAIDVNNMDCIDTVIRVVAAPVGIPGDLDGDLCVGQPDLGILLSCFGTSDCGDLDGDGQTGQADLGILLANWGNGCP
ncbi:MAG TPA: hypothetical protein PKC49_13990 [Phycisphaerae bacterium]|nr:hypothetical protein [Phycisphaerae bacterium]